MHKPKPHRPIYCRRCYVLGDTDAHSALAYDARAEHYLCQDCRYELDYNEALDEEHRARAYEEELTHD